MVVEKSLSIKELYEMVGGGGGTVKRREYGAITIEYCEREVEGFC